MLFRNPVLLAGLVGVLIPVILHLIRRQAAKPYDWGAMRFLFDTVAARRRRMEWEDFLLMIARCLLIALIVLAVARPFVPPNSGIPLYSPCILNVFSKREYILELFHQFLCENFSGQYLLGTRSKTRSFSLISLCMISAREVQPSDFKMSLNVVKKSLSNLKSE